MHSPKRLAVTGTTGKTRAKQLPLPLQPRFGHGGRRPGAGRPRSSKFQSHVRREEFQARHPLHVTVRLHDGLPSLRGKAPLRSLRRAVAKAREHGLAIAHFAILSNHLHLVLESESREALGLQMQSLGVSLAKRLNAQLRRRGAVFRERYHVHVLRTPTEVKRALRYVLANAYQHAGKRGRISLDLFSSAVTVADSSWRELLGANWGRIVGFPDGANPDEEQRLLEEVSALLQPPRTWLLTRGWLRA